MCKSENCSANKETFGSSPHSQRKHLSRAAARKMHKFAASCIRGGENKEDNSWLHQYMYNTSSKSFSPAAVSNLRCFFCGAFCIGDRAHTRRRAAKKTKK
jgi:hypothetical protein